MTGDREALTVADRLTALRSGSFVGRRDELARFRAIIAPQRHDCRLVWVYGPGGVGKTSLVAQFAQLARASGRPVTTVDARDVEMTRDGLAAALGTPVPGQVTIVDTFELCRPLESWLRQTLVPAWPADMVLVLASRYAPSADWLGDDGWREVLHPLPLRNLRPEESREFLRSRGVAGVQQESVIGLTHGHPLALALVAQSLAAGGRLAPVLAEQEPELVRVLLQRFVDDVPSPRHRAALQTCAHVRVTTEEILRDALGGDDVGELFDWLRGLSFIEQGPHGLFPHDLARDVIDADLRWRDPPGYRTLHAAARASVVRRIQSSDGVWQDRALFDFLFLHRNSPLMARFMDWDSLGALRPVPATADTFPDVLAMIERHEGAVSASIARHWFAHQPHGFWCFTDPDGAVVGAHATLDLHQATPDQTMIDPATSAAMAYVHRHGPLRPGDEVLYHRFYLSRDTYQAPSPAVNLFSIMSNRYWLTRPRLAWTFMATADPDYWQPLFSYLNFRRSPEADFEVGRRYGVFTHDWRAEPLAVWFERMEERELAVTADVVGSPAVPEHPVVVLSEPEFHAAVRQALRLYTRPDALATNPLLRSRILMEPGGAAAGPEDLRRLLRDAAQSLRANPRDERLYRAVLRTYLEPAATQELAAQRLGLPFSTYRRHLTSGVERICALLWHRELHSAALPG